MAWTQKKIEEVYKQVELKAAQDKDFRQLLLEDPNTAISQVSDEKVPEGLKIKFIEKDPTYNATFVLPDLMSNEIDDDDLDKVAGGLSTILISSDAVIACAVAVSDGNCMANTCGAEATASGK